jgi:hypothetical protein
MRTISQFLTRDLGSRITHHGSLPILSLLLTLASNAAEGTLTISAGYVSDIDNSGLIDFALQFNRAPDFFTCDDYGRQADAFQFYIATSTNVPVSFPPRPYASLIRGGEISYDNHIVIRNDGPPDEAEPHSGGWGFVRGAVTYTLNTDTLTFSVPAEVLDVQGPFAYSLLLTSFGAATHDPFAGGSGGPISIPEPGPLFLVLAASVARLLLFPFRTQRAGRIMAGQIHQSRMAFSQCDSVPS